MTLMVTTTTLLDVRMGAMTLMSRAIVASNFEEFSDDKCEKTKDCVCSQKEIEALKNEVRQLKQHVVSLEEALSEESSLKSDLIQINHQMEREMMRKLKAMTTWLMEKRASLCQNQHQYGINFTSAGHNRKEQVHINQSSKPRFNIANPYVNLDNPSTNEMPESKKSPEDARNEEANLQNLAGGFERTLHKKKVSLNHNTYSGSRIGLRYLFKENSPQKERPLSADETYSGSNLSLRFLFGEPIPDKARTEQTQQHSGSNHSLGRRFEERFYGRGRNKPTSSGNTYSGSNLALSYLFNEESEDAATNLTAIAENSSCAKCSCQCKARAGNERKGKDTTNTENMKLMKDNVDEGFKRKTKKSVQINSKKLSVYFQSDIDQQEVLQPNDVRTESNPEAGSNYLVEIKDNFLVKVTEQTNRTSVSQDAKSAPVSDTITSTNCRPAAHKNLATGSGAQGTSHTPTMVGTIQSIEMTDISSLSQLTVIKDVNIISIPTSADAATAQPLHTLEKVDLDATMTPPLAILGPEENKKRKRCSATGSSALSKPKNADDSASAAMPTKNKIPKNACLASGSEFSNFIYTVKQRLPKSPTVTDDLARSSTLIEPVKAQSPPVTTTSHCTTGASGTKSESKTLPLMSVHSTGTGSTISTTQRTKVLPPPSCPLLPPPNQARLQPAFKPDTNDEYPPLPSAGPNIVEMKPSPDKDDTSYASVTRRDKKPVNRPDAAMCSLHSLAKLAKNIILKYYKPGEEMNQSHVKAAIEMTDISSLAQNQQDSQKQTTEKTSQNNQQESVESTRLGNAQNREDLLSAAKQEVCLKTATLSTVIREALVEEKDTTTQQSLAKNQTPANKEPIKTRLSAAVQTDTEPLQTSLTVAAQDSLKLNTISTNGQDSVKTEDAQTKRRDINKKVTIKTGQKDSAEKDQAPNRKQRSMKADPNTRQHNVSAGPTGTESIKTTPVQSILQRETSHEEPLRTDLNTATMIGSPTIDPVHTTTPQNPPSTDPHPARDSQDSPKTDKSSPAAVQKVKKTKQTPTKRQDANQKSPTKTNPNATSQPDPPDTRSRLSKHVANMQQQQQQDDQSKHT